MIGHFGMAATNLQNRASLKSPLFRRTSA